MAAFVIDAQLRRDGFVLGRLPLCHVLLMNNAAVPWLVLVPETDHIELCDLARETRHRLDDEIDCLAHFLRANFALDKLNIAALGNIVRQLHVHVVARRRDDYCWPGAIWGTPAPATYAPSEVARIGALLAHSAPTDFEASDLG